MKELAKNFGINYIARKKNVDAKAGNLNNVLKQANSPYMLVLDADMVPKKCILKKMIPFFVDTENQNKNKPENEKYKLGFVQSPQSFYRSDMFQHALKLNHKVMQENNYFFRYDQAGRNEKNLVTYCGTGAVLSRAAIDEIGGFHTQALTEDLPQDLKLETRVITTSLFPIVWSRVFLHINTRIISGSVQDELLEILAACANLKH